jgi:cytochrome c peroxidase
MHGLTKGHLQRVVAWQWGTPDLKRSGAAAVQDIPCRPDVPFHNPSTTEERDQNCHSLRAMVSAGAVNSLKKLRVLVESGEVVAVKEASFLSGIVDGIWRSRRLWTTRMLICFVITSVATVRVNGQDDLRRRGRGRGLPSRNVFEGAGDFGNVENTEVEAEEDIFSSFDFQDRLHGFKPLSEVEVPQPRNLYDFIRDREAALILGKALFWDMQVGSDGKTACATCHFHAGADSRWRNSVAPNGSRFRGANAELAAHDFPFHRLQDQWQPKGSDNPAVFDTSEIAGSQGVVKTEFLNIVDGVPKEPGRALADNTFAINGARARQVTGRNAPSVINSVFNHRNFWDGRARSTFNGVNPFGDMDPDAKVWVTDEPSGPFPFGKAIDGPDAFLGTLPLFDEGDLFSDFNDVFGGPAESGRNQSPIGNVQVLRESDMSTAPSDGTGRLRQIRIQLENASLASQAVGPPLSDVEMSWKNRSFPELGMKMLTLRPLALQRVHPQDSVLGRLASRRGRGLDRSVSYRQLIRQAFHERYWDSAAITPEGFTLMEQNFSLFWGLSLMVYQSTLVSDDTPFDRWLRGDRHALTPLAQRGFELFVNEGKCANCHSGPEFTAASVSKVTSRSSRNTNETIEWMETAQGPHAFYDGGFYNIGVRPTTEDRGVGGEHPQLGSWSFARRVQQGLPVMDEAREHSVSSYSRLAVDGAFKTPGLRNIELTGPYMHNGGMRTLEEVVLFYARGADFESENIQDLAPDVSGIDEVIGSRRNVRALVEFMKTLTDERVRHRRAPFDHPELVIPNGHRGSVGGIALDADLVLEAVGRQGGEALLSFEELAN